jgi:hypothetical protein
MQFASFPNSEWTVLVNQMQSEHGKLANDMRDQVRAAPAISIEAVTSGVTVHIPRISSFELHLAFVGQTLRMFDELSATKSALMRNFGSVRFSFEGQDGDSRPIWELDEIARFFRYVDKHAPWWPWLVERTQLPMWLSAIATDPQTNVMGKLSPASSREVNEALLERLVKATIGAVIAARMDAETQDVKERIRTLYELLHAGLTSTGLTQSATSPSARVPHNDSAAEPGKTIKMHCAFALDHSEKGRELVGVLTSGRVSFIPKPILDELNDWATRNDSPLAVVVGVPGRAQTWVFRASGDSDDELRGHLATVKASATASQAAIAWTVAVSEKLTERFSRVASSMAEKQQHPSGFSESRSYSQMLDGLLNLALDPGGQEIDFDSVQITDAKLAGKVFKLILDTLSGALSTGNKFDMAKLIELNLDTAWKNTVRAWTREDGSLLVRQVAPRVGEVIVPAGKWGPFDKSKSQLWQQQALENMFENPRETYEQLSGMFSESVESSNREENALLRALGDADSAVGLFGRETPSVAALQRMIGTQPKAKEAAERWLASDDTYFLFFRAKDGRLAYRAVVDRAELFSGLLAKAIEFNGSPSSTLLYPMTGTALDVEVRVWWAEHGGLVVAEASRGP